MAATRRDVPVEPADVVEGAFAVVLLARDLVHHGLDVGRLRIPRAAVVEVRIVELRDALAAPREDARLLGEGVVVLAEVLEEAFPGLNPVLHVRLELIELFAVQSDAGMLEPPGERDVRRDGQQQC